MVMPKFLQNIFSRGAVWNQSMGSKQNEECKQNGEDELSMELQQRVMQYLVQSMTCNLMVRVAAALPIVH